MLEERQSKVLEDRFKVIRQIDEGSFGTVLMAKSKKDDEIVAIKKIKRKYCTWDECVSLREVKSLRKLNHQNIIKLMEVLKINDELFLVFEFVESNLFNLYQDYKKQVKIFFHIFVENAHCKILLFSFL